MQTQKRVVKYRGITNVVRRAIQKGELKGIINPSDVRHLLPEAKASAPDQVINRSLNQMARKDELHESRGVFSTKEFGSAPTSSAGKPSESVITGTILDTRVENGKILATVEVKSLDN